MFIEPSPGSEIAGASPYVPWGKIGVKPSSPPSPMVVLWVPASATDGMSCVPFIGWWFLVVAFFFFSPFTVTTSRSALDSECRALGSLNPSLFPLRVSASVVLVGGGGGGNADAVTSTALVWASQDKEKVSVPLPRFLPGISSLAPPLARSLEPERNLGDVLS